MNMQDDKEATTSKKEYAKPELVVYGNIVDLTENITDNGVNMDNPTKKT